MNQDIFSPQIFLTYANTPLKDNPQGLHKTLDEMIKSADWRDNEPEVRRTIDEILKFNEKPYSKEEIEKIDSNLAAVAQAMLVDRSDRRGHWSSDLDVMLLDDKDRRGHWSSEKREIVEKGEKELIDYEKEHGEPFPFFEKINAFDYSFHKESCCEYAKLRNKIFETSSLKCYECDHKYLVYLLTAITEGKEYSKIYGFRDLLANFPKGTRELSLFASSKSPFKEEIKAEITYDDFFMPYRDSGHFPYIFRDAVSNSLIFFLLHNDRRKLKKCAICGKFFIAERDLKRKFCYPPRNCEWEAKKKRQREFMKRKRDKDGPDFDPRYL